MYLHVSDGVIQELSAKPISTSGARVIDVGGRTVMPGLIDDDTARFAAERCAYIVPTMVVIFCAVRDGAAAWLPGGEPGKGRVRV